MQRLAPIVIFVFNRPWHTQQTLEALSKNELADQSVLYIYCDGPRKDESLANLEQISKTRAVVRSQQWAKEVIIIEKEQNAGLGTSIIAGVTEVINKHGKVIVLEDDLVTSTSFLRYMNDTLTLYENEERVMHISAYWFPVKESARLLPATFFFRSTSCWGWGTWQRAWQKLETNSYELKKQIGRMPDGIKRFNIENALNHLSQLENNITGKTNTWAVKWYATVFLNNGLCLHPHISFVNNIGFDNTGTHCDSTSVYDWPELASRVDLSPIPLQESQPAVQMLHRFYKSAGGGVTGKIKRVLSLLKQQRLP